MEQIYWASKPIEDIAAEIEEKFDRYQDHLEASGYANRIKTVYDTFYGITKKGNLSIERDDQDVALMRVNHFKSLIRRLHILVTENKLAFTPRSKNSDTKSSIEADFAKGIVEYYNQEKGMNAVLSESVLGALLMLEYFIHAPWDFNDGYELTANEGQVIKTGDQIFRSLSVFDLAKSTASKKTDWYIVREKVNKYNLASQFPQFETEILSNSIERSNTELISFIDSDDDEDYIHKYILYHARSPILPQGRRTEIAASQVLSDGGLRYSKIPVFRISAGDMLQTIFADSPTVELVSLQEAIDAIFSGVITNNLNNNLQMIWSPDPNMVVKTLSDGQKMVTSAQEPKALNLTGSSPENIKIIEMLIQNQQLLSGVNDVARGNPSSNLKSGTSLALVLSQAIQYVSELQKSYAEIAGDIGSCLIDNVKIFQPEELTAYIVGENKKGQLKKFKADDIMDVERVTVELGNPLTQTYAGRQEMMQNWMQYGIIKDPKQIVSFLTTGNVDAEIENRFSDAILIKSENEMLRKGEIPTVIMTDRHAEHINDHVVVYSDPLVRESPELMQSALNHIMEHLTSMREVPPDLAAVLSGQPLPQMPMPSDQGQRNMPTVEGARMPSLPAETPPQEAENYQEDLQTIPSEQPQELPI